MIEIQFAVIVLLVAMTLVLSRYYNTRFRACLLYTSPSPRD